MQWLILRFFPFKTVHGLMGWNSESQFAGQNGIGNSESISSPGYTGQKHLSEKFNRGEM
jgi:hypothetical protein